MKNFTLETRITAKHLSLIYVITLIFVFINLVLIIFIILCYL